MSRVGLFEVIENGLIGHGLVVLALDALAGVRAKHSLLETLTILLHAKGLAARTSLTLLSTVHLYCLRSSAADNPLIYFAKVASFLVATVHTLAILVALQTCREALAVQLHALGVSTVANLLLTH